MSEHYPPDHAPDEHDVIIEWSQRPDVFSDRCLYEEGGVLRDKHWTRKHPTGGPERSTRDKTRKFRVSALRATLHSDRREFRP